MHREVGLKLKQKSPYLLRAGPFRYLERSCKAGVWTQYPPVSGKFKFRIHRSDCFWIELIQGWTRDPQTPYDFYIVLDKLAKFFNGKSAGKRRKIKFIIQQQIKHIINKLFPNQRKAKVCYTRDHLRDWYVISRWEEEPSTVIVSARSCCLQDALSETRPL